MKYRIEQGLFELFPDFVRGVIVATNVDNTAEQDASDLYAQLLARIRTLESDSAFSPNHPLIEVWTDVYRRFPAKSMRKARPSIGAMLRRIKNGSGQQIPFISPLVCISNIVALTYLLPSGLIDADTTYGDLLLGFAEGTETFLPFGAAETRPDAGEIVYKDTGSNTVMCGSWNSRGGQINAVTSKTRTVVVDIDGLLTAVPRSLIEEATAMVAGMIRDYCGGTTDTYFLDKDRTELEMKNYRQNFRIPNAVSGGESRAEVTVMSLPSTTTPVLPRLLSGMQPTGEGKLHLGNYEGALKTWVQLQAKYEMFCFVADWHALTTLAGSPQSIADASRNVVLDYLSVGLDPSRCVIFRQSQVPEHAELALLLGMLAPLSWLERVPTYKEKRLHTDELGAVESGVSYGLLGYPVLQAADILIYRPQLVPVGKDQEAHLELTRSLARRFNHLYNTNFFPDPQALISETTGVLPGLDGRKMSKSYGNTIFLSDDAETVNSKLKSAFTSPLKVRKSDEGEPEGCVVCQLRRVYDADNFSSQWEECRFGKRGCVQSKSETAEAINAVLDPIRTRRKQFENDPGGVEKILTDGSERARQAADETLQVVRKIMRLK